MEELQQHWKVVDNHFVLTSRTTGVEVKIPLDPMIGMSYTTEGLLSVVSQSFGVGNVREWARHSIPTRYRLFLNEFGMTCSNAAKVIRHMRYDAVEPYREWANKFAYKGHARSYSSDQLQKIKLMLPILEQAKKDGNMHITPFIYSLEADPSKLKEFFGKALWKKLCKNSFTRNRKICQAATYKEYGRLSHRGVYGSSFPYLSSDCCTDNQYVVDNLERLRRNIKNINRFQSRFIDFKHSWTHISSVTDDDIDYVIKHQKSIKSLDELYSIYHTLSDTVVMVNDLRRAGVIHRKPTIDLSLDELNNLHAEVVCAYNYQQNRINAAKNAKLNEQFAQQISEYGDTEKIVRHSEFTATMITTPEDLLNEGRTMHHCVASYSDRIARGQYLVYHVTKNGEDYSTLGIWVGYEEIEGAREKRLIRDQHYCKCNASIPKEDMHSIGMLESIILSTLKEETYECA